MNHSLFRNSKLYKPTKPVPFVEENRTIPFLGVTVTQCVCVCVCVCVCGGGGGGGGLAKLTVLG